MFFRRRRTAAMRIVKRSAFTLTETLMAVAIITAIASFSIPAMRDLVERNTIKSAGDLLLEAARTAQLRARSGQTEALESGPWGMHAGLGVVFNNETLAQSTVQESFAYTPGVVVSGVADTVIEGVAANTQELFFEAPSGRPKVMINGSSYDVQQMIVTLRSPNGLRLMLFVCPHAIFTTGIVWPGRTYNYDCSGDVNANIPPTSASSASANSSSSSSAPRVALSEAQYVVGEDAGSLELTFLRWGGSGPASVEYVVHTVTTAGVRDAVAGADYVTMQGTVVFPTPGAVQPQEQTISVAILDDESVEGDEWFDVVITDVSGNTAMSEPSRADLLIADDDTPCDVWVGSRCGLQDICPGSGQSCPVEIFNRGPAACAGITLTRLLSPGAAFADGGSPLWHVGPGIGGSLLGVGNAPTDSSTADGTLRTFRYDGVVQRHEGLIVESSIVATANAIITDTVESDTVDWFSPNNLWIEPVTVDPTCAESERVVIQQFPNTPMLCPQTAPATLLMVTAQQAGAMTADIDIQLSTCDLLPSPVEILVDGPPCVVDAGTRTVTCDSITLTDGIGSVSFTRRWDLSSPSCVSGDVEVSASATFQPSGETVSAAALSTALACSNPEMISLVPSTANEVDGVAVVGVQRTGDLSGNVTVQYTTTNGSALSGSDYVATSGMLSFLDGQTAAFIPVSLIDDEVEESAEHFVVTLSNPSGASLGVEQTAVGIMDDDSGGGFCSVNVLYDCAPLDICGGSRVTCEIHAGAGGASDAHYPSVNVYLQSDMTFEGWVGTPAIYENYEGTGPAVSALTTDVIPGGGWVNGTQLRLYPTYGTSLQRGDWVVARFTAIAEEGESTFHSASISAMGDGGPCAHNNIVYHESADACPAVDGVWLAVSPSGPVCTDDSAIVTVTGRRALAADEEADVEVTFALDIDAQQILGPSVAGGSCSISGQTATCTNVPLDDEGFFFLTLDVGPAIEVDGVAQAIEAEVTWPDDEVESAEPTSVTQVACSAPAGDAGTVDMVTDDIAIIEGNNGGSMPLELTVQRTGGTVGTISVDIATVNGTTSPGDYTGVSSTLTFYAGQVYHFVTVTILGDDALENDEAFTASLSNPAGGAAIGAPSATTVTILDDDAPPGGSSSLPGISASASANPSSAALSSAPSSASSHGPLSVASAAASAFFENTSSTSSEGEGPPEECTETSCGTCANTPNAFTVAAFGGSAFGHNGVTCGITAPATTYPAVASECTELNMTVGSELSTQGLCQWAAPTDFDAACFNDAAPYDGLPSYPAERWILLYNSGLDRWELYPAGQSTMRYVQNGVWNCTASHVFVRDPSQTSEDIQACATYPSTVTVTPDATCT